LPVGEIFAESAAHYRGYWTTSDIVVAGQAGVQQAVRWNLFQLAQATARADVAGIPAKGVSGSGYDGHYFWDQEVYLMPYLSYTNPANARQVLEFRHEMLPEARIRAKELSVDGALFPWRTINGLEASAYYAAGTAQFHIAAAIAFATNRYVWASGDQEFRDTLGAELLIETARMWVSLGFFGKDGLFHIHGVTGPDEYTAVVNDNLYTNVMARFNLRAAAALDHAEIDDAERQLWEQAANRMQLPYDEDLQVHSQDNDFMTLEPWDWSTPRAKYPLLLHFHPLVIYRHQVVKQADTVLAMFLQWQDFTAEEKRRAFDFYDPITTGDSTLSACVQGIMAAEVGYGQAALDHFTHALFIDLDDTHGNTIDGVHIASTGGVWSSLVSGFAGLRDQAAVPYFDPRLPAGWDGLAFHLKIRGRLLHVELDQAAIRLSIREGGPLDVSVRGELVTVGTEPVQVPLAPVAAPDPTIFPSGLPTASIPIVRANA
jgi:alpha,alpha-trehalose phosphorylase